MVVEGEGRDGIGEGRVVVRIRGVGERCVGWNVLIMVTHNLDRKHAQISLMYYRKI